MQVQNPALHCVTARRNSAGDAGQGRGCGSGAGRREGLKRGEKREGVKESGQDEEGKWSEGEGLIIFWF